MSFTLICKLPSNSFPATLKSKWCFELCDFFNFENYFIISGASVVEAGTSESYKNNKANCTGMGLAS